MNDRPIYLMVFGSPRVGLLFSSRPTLTGLIAALVGLIALKTMSLSSKLKGHVRRVDVKKIPISIS